MPARPRLAIKNRRRRFIRNEKIAATIQHATMNAPTAIVKFMASR